MKLTLLPPRDDDLIRLRCEGMLRQPDEEDPLLALLGPHCYRHKVLLSLERAPSFDTSGLSWLMHAQKRFQQAGGRLVLYAVPPLVTDTLAFMRLADLFDVAAGDKEAAELLRCEERKTAGRGGGEPPPLLGPRSHQFGG